MISSRCLALLAASGAAVAQEFTSLFLPVFEPQPLSADVVGVGNDGATTWALQRPTEVNDFLPTVTYIEGSDYISLGQAIIDMSGTTTYAVACTMSASVAECSMGVNGVMDTDVLTYEVTRIPAQLGTSTAGVAISSTTVKSTESSGSFTPPPPDSTTIKFTQLSGSSTAAPPNPTTSTSNASGKWEVPLYTMLMGSFLMGLAMIA